jgi:hypothetical protein
MQDMVERLARMTQEERDRFEQELVLRWPHLAEAVSRGIQHRLEDLFRLTKDKTGINI